MTIYGLDTFLSQFWNSQLFHVWFYRTSWTVYRFLRRQVRWSDIPISKNFPQFVVIHTVEGLSVLNETEVDVFLECFCFFYDPTNIGNLISGPLPFLNSACTSGHSRFTYCWSQIWRIRDTKGTFHVRMSTIKDRNSKDLTEAEETKKRWQEYSEELYKMVLTTWIATMVWMLT